MSEFVDGLKSLHTALIDSREGYEEALSDAEGRGLTPLFREMIAMRTRHHAELDAMLKSAGQQPDESGSMMATVHRTVIKVRSLFGGLGQNILPGLIDGEERVVSYYDEVLEENVSPQDRQIIVAQRRDVEKKIADMKNAK